MNQATEILYKHWGYSDFRASQKEVVSKVLNKEHCIALLPTGGGKSICYQVPGLVLGGITLVISPLVSLMEDQVSALVDKGIPALNLSGKISEYQILKLFERIEKQEFRFVFMAPERLENKLLKEWLPRWNITLLAIDEAHCVSQWGHDFRPSYLGIKEAVKDLICPILALTATATSEVIEDIARYVFPKPEVNLISKSFYRSNLAFFVKKTENKQQYILRVCNKFKSTGIVYTRSRKNTLYWCNLLKENGINALPYHAGMPVTERDKNQQQWMQSDNTVMVATSAFGMGIDKPNCRFVIHPELPESLEAYIQEAGRAGRDGNKAFSVVLYHNEDLQLLEEKLIHNRASKQELFKFYQALHNFLQIPLEAGQGYEVYIDLEKLAAYSKTGIKRCMELLSYLQLEGILESSDSQNQYNKVSISLSPEMYFKPQLQHETLHRLREALTRLYHGIFEFPVSINPEKLAKHLEVPFANIHPMLEKLQQLKLLHYYPLERRWRLKILKNRSKNEAQIFSEKKTELITRRKDKSFESITQYLSLKGHNCRQVFLCSYFDDNIKACGSCDLCLLNKEAKDIEKLIMDELKLHKSLKISALLSQNTSLRLQEEAFHNKLADLQAQGAIIINTDNDTLKLA